jgi:RsiW-degrading membrane proteinase PrsW (M82 family)
MEVLLCREEDAPPPSAPEQAGRRLVPRLQPWLRVLLAGAGLWAVGVSVLAVSSDRYVVPTVVLGCFVVPVACAVRVRDRNPQVEVGGPLLVRLFVVGGAAGFLGSAVIETQLRPGTSAVLALLAGVIEESLKLVTLVVLTRPLRRPKTLEGFVLGAVVGFGFAAFESSGYALSSLTTSGSHAAMEWMVLTRAAITPVSHGLWTGIAGAALFRWRAAGVARRDAWSFVVAFAAAVALHAAWDLVPNLSNGLGAALTDSAHHVSLLPARLPPHATVLAQAASSAFDCAGLLLLAVVGVWFAHDARRRGRAEILPAPGVPSMAARPVPVASPADPAAG